MSYTTPSYEPPAPPARPGTVGLATTLLYLLALLSLISVGLTIYSATFYDQARIQEIFENAGMDATQAEAQAVGTVVGGYIGAGFVLLTAVGYLISAIFVGKGKQWARILAWVWAGVFGICCGGAGLVLQGAANSLANMGGSAGGVDLTKAQEEVMKLVPGWLNSASLVLGIISLLAAIGVVILLALPPSSPFFRKPEAQWTPPTYPAP